MAVCRDQTHFCLVAEKDAANSICDCFHRAARALRNDGTCRRLHCHHGDAEILLCRRDKGARLAQGTWENGPGGNRPCLPAALLVDHV